MSQGDATGGVRKKQRGLAWQWRLTRKELREILRDRRTIMTLVLMPILLYPLLSVALQRFLLTGLTRAQDVTYFIGTESDADSTMLNWYLHRGDEELRQPAATPLSSLQIRIMDARSLEYGVTEMMIDVGVRFNSPPRPPQPLDCTLVYRNSSAISETGLKAVQERVEAYNDSRLALQLKAAGIDAPRPLMTKSVGAGKADMVSLASLIPLVLVLMTITGAVYPAIDLTAGERERGTMEALMASPIPKLSLLLAKYIAVVCVAMLTATVNLAAMSVTLWGVGLADALFGQHALSLLTIVQVFLLLTLLSTFFAGVLLAITSQARSFKEAQAYLIPLMLLALTPGVVSLMPGIELQGMMTLAPLINVVLLSRNILQGEAELLPALLVVVSTTCYSALALRFAARSFGKDAMSYGSQADWRQLLRRPLDAHDYPSLNETFACFAIILPLYFVLASALTQFGGLDLQSRITSAAAVTLVLFGVVPLVVSRVRRIRVATTFRVHGAPLLSFVSAVLLGLVTWPLAHQLLAWGAKFGVGGITVDRLSAVKEYMETLRTISPTVILLCLAVMPALCEEFFFRGFLFTALRRSTTARGVVVLSALLFGAFHTFSGNVLTPERFLPSTFLGLVLGWVCWRTGSILPGILLHAVHNGLLLMAGFYMNELQARFPFLGIESTDSLDLPVSWWLASIVGVSLGTGLLAVSTRKAARQP